MFHHYQNSYFFAFAHSKLWSERKPTIFCSGLWSPKARTKYCCLLIDNTKLEWEQCSKASLALRKILDKLLGVCPNLAVVWVTLEKKRFKLSEKKLDK
jgi:hypothetical protein